MGRTMILNASPRAPRSNSKQYAALFSECYPFETEYFELLHKDPLALIESMGEFSDVLFVFPLYADGIPATLLQFLKVLEEHPPKRKPVASVLVNCGFIEPGQNDVAVEMMRLFCRRNGYRFGSVLRIGSGEAILTTPFRAFVARKIKKLAGSVATGKHQNLKVTMPIPKGMYIKASETYWANYGAKYGVTKEQMATMQIEDSKLGSDGKAGS